MFDPYRYYKRRTKSTRKGQILRKKVALQSGDSHAYTMNQIKYWGNTLIKSNQFVQEVMDKKIKIINNDTWETVKLVGRPLIQQAAGGSIRTVHLYKNILKSLPQPDEQFVNQTGNLLNKTSQIARSLFKGIDMVADIYYRIRNARVGFIDNNFLQYEEELHNLLEFQQNHRAIEWEGWVEQNRINLQEEGFSSNIQFPYFSNQQPFVSAPHATAEQIFSINPISGQYLMDGISKGVNSTAIIYNDSIEAVMPGPSFTFHVSKENISKFLSGEYFPDDEHDYPFAQLRILSGQGYTDADLNVEYEFIFDISIVGYQIIE